MPDSKVANNGVARRNTRVFESDIDLGQIREAVSDNGAGYNRKSGEREKSQEIERSGEMRVETRTSSMSTLVPVDDDILEGYEKLARKISEEAIENLSQDEIVETPKIPGRPRNFGTVVPGIYRSGYPEAEDHEFLSELGLKTIVTLVDKDHPESYRMFMQSNGIKHIVIKMDGTKKVDIPRSVMNQILEVVLDRQNHPLLLHCNQGRHRTGCAVAVIRKVMGWSIESVVSEYTTYAHPKVREVDVKYIHRFEVADLIGIIEPSFIKMPNVIKPRGEVIKPRPVSRSNKMRKMVLVTIVIMVIWGMTYFHSRMR